MADTGDEHCSCNRPLCPSCYEQTDSDDPSDSEDQDSNNSEEEFDCNCVGDQAENCTCFQEDSDSDQLRPISPPVVHYHQHYYTVVVPSASPSFFSPPHFGLPQTAPSTLPAPRFLPVTYEPPPPYDPKVEQENTDDEQNADEQEQDEQGRYNRLPHDLPPPPPPDLPRLPEIGMEKTRRKRRYRDAKTVSATTPFLHYDPRTLCILPPNEQTPPPSARSRARRSKNN